MKKRIALLLSLILILLITAFAATNYTCLKRLSVAHGYSKDNGLSLTYGISSFFSRPDYNMQEYALTKNAVISLGNIDGSEFIEAAKKSSKNNSILKGKLDKTQGKHIIHIDQCIFLKDINSMYLFCHTDLRNNSNIIHLAVSDSNGNFITQAAFTDEKKGSILRTSENYFWGIDYSKYDKMNLTVKVYTSKNEFLYEYNQPLY